MTRRRETKLEEMLRLRQPPAAGSRPAGWPMRSLAAGVHTKQIGEATEHARKHGVPTEFHKSGDAIFTSRAHRKKYCRLIGLHDKQGGYGDP